MGAWPICDVRVTVKLSPFITPVTDALKRVMRSRFTTTGSWMYWSGILPCNLPDLQQFHHFHGTAGSRPVPVTTIRSGGNWHVNNGSSALQITRFLRLHQAPHDTSPESDHPVPFLIMQRFA